MNDSPVEEVTAVLGGCLLALVTKWIVSSEPWSAFQFCAISLLWANVLLGRVREKFYYRAWWENFTKNTCYELDDDTGDDGDQDAGEISDGQI